MHNAGDSYSGRKTSTIKKNKEAGKKFEKENFAELQKTHPKAETQVPVKPSDGGGRLYLDGLALDSEGMPFIHEYKASGKAPYTPNQRAQGYPSGSLTGGGTVVGKGKGVFTPGYEIPAGTPVYTIRGGS